ncbi:MAG: hypothetical protein JW910_15495 [Anaerolineae bacterium]|nr:hypothetical protein [Anaerolineae bacterium]
MSRKLLVTTVIVGLSCILILGAVNRTLARLGSPAENGAANAPEADIAPDSTERLALTGTVTSADADVLLVASTAGDVLIEGRAWRYAREQSFVAAPGEAITLEGFYEDGEFKVTQITNETRQTALLVRDASGQPMWGRGGHGG